jgi:hypothetical protein
MGCCGSRRAQAAQAAQAVPRAAAAARPVAAAPGPNGYARVPTGIRGRGAAGGGAVVLRYRERARVQVRGPVTGRVYEFSAGQPTQPVDARDAQTLLRTRLFTTG